MKSDDLYSMADIARVCITIFGVADFSKYGGNRHRCHSRRITKFGV